MNCYCTNQCQACGACCAVGCEHRGVALRARGRGVGTAPSGPLPLGLPLTEADVRRILREELARLGVRERLDEPDGPSSDFDGCTS